MKTVPLWTVAMVVLAVQAGRAVAVPRVWVGGTDNDWFNALNWNPSDAAPQDGDTVQISGGASVVLSNQTANMGSFLISNATLIFTNWNTALRAANVIVDNGAILTLPGAFTEAQMSNRVHVICGNFTLNAGATINADYLGFFPHNGPGKGTFGRESDGWASPGAGYGGRGGQAYAWLAQTQGVVYGSAHAPVEPGSGGGSTNNYVSEGGGAVRIEASGQVLIHGTITANGRDMSNGGSGSGGSIYISCDTFGGDATGVLRANGGGGGGGSDGVGGGGRIAVHYASGLSGAPRVRLSANLGIWSSPATDHLSASHPTDLHRYRGSMGTLSFPDGQLLDTLLSSGTVTGLYGYVHLQSGSVWTSAAPSSLTISRSLLGIPEDSAWKLAQNLVLTNGGIIAEYGSVLQSSANLTLTNGGTLTVFSAATNGTTESYGALVTVAGTLSVASNGWIFPYSDPTNGGSPFFDVGVLRILDGGGFNASGRGFTRDAGPGKGQPYYGQGGGGYGGRGGYTWTEAYAGPVYGSTNAPMQPGSGGGSYGLSPGDIGYRGGFGGGLVRIEVAGAWTHEGAILAVGTNSSRAASGGAGGGIYVVCQSLKTTTSAVLNANGGDGRGGDYNSAGGGGRIAVWVGVSEDQKNAYQQGNSSRVEVDDTHTKFLGTMTVVNGLSQGEGFGYNPPDPQGAQPGTAFFYTERKIPGFIHVIR